MKRFALVVVAAAALAPAASAKELLGLQLCGASGCATDRSPALRGTMHGGPFGGGGEALAPAAPGPWYRAYGLAGENGRVRGRIELWYVPGAKLLAAPGDGGQTTAWQRPDPAWQRALERLATRVSPFPAPVVTTARVNGKRAADPQSYLDLYTVGTTAATYPRDTEMVQVELASTSPTPWTSGNYLAVYPNDRLLVRDGQIVAIPADVADAAATGASLDVRDSFPWASLLGGLAAVAALAGLVLRLWPRPRPAPQAAPQT